MFHLLGFDIMFDKEGKGWLLEVNSNPSLNINLETGFMDSKESEFSPIDAEIKLPLITHSIRLAHLLRKKGRDALPSEIGSEETRVELIYDSEKCQHPQI